MKTYHAGKFKKNYFEGWYFKQCTADHTLALIPGMALDGSGRFEGFLQVITNRKSFWIPFSRREFYADPQRLYIRVGRSIFTAHSIHLDLEREELSLCGDLKLDNFTPLNYDIMGPFAHLPNMECQHGILSIAHRVDGTVNLNGEVLPFDGGKGYLEKDRGHSFPKSYFWAQCNCFEGVECALTVAIATIPYGPVVFTGLIAVLTLEGKEYRLATYNGGRVLHLDRERLVLGCGKLRLALVYPQDGGHRLTAPTAGSMERSIHENASCKIGVRLWSGGELIYAGRGCHAGVELVGFDGQWGER